MTTFCQHCKGEFQDNNFAIANGGYIHAKCGQVTMTTNDRMQWLAAHDWIVDARFFPVRCEVEGKWHWLDGPGHKTIYVRDSDGAGIILGGPRDVMTWQQLQDWVEGKRPEAKKPLQGQRNLFGDDE